VIMIINRREASAMKKGRLLNIGITSVRNKVFFLMLDFIVHF
jgi:hypothetical protein